MDKIKKRDYKMWGEKFHAFCNRIIHFSENPIVVIYFAIIIIFIGSFGVWNSALGKYCCNWNFFSDSKTLENLATYTISIGAAAMADFLLDKKEKTKGLRMLVFTMFLIGFLFSIISLTKQLAFFGYFGTIITLLLWITVYADDENKSEKDDDSYNSSGGSKPETVEIQGNLNTFKS